MAQPHTDAEPYAGLDSVQDVRRVALTFSGGVSNVVFSDRYALSAGGTLGAVFAGRWTVEGYFQTMIDRFSKRVVFPEVYRYKMWIAGLSARYNIINHQRYYLFTALNGGLAHTSWTPTESLAASFTDYVYLLAPEAGIGFRFFPFMSVEVGAKYNKALGFELVGLEKDALDGMEFAVRLRFSGHKINGTGE